MEINRFRSEAAQMGMDARNRMEGPSGMPDSISWSPTERNAGRYARIRRRNGNLVRNAGKPLQYRQL
jgi:hypothetical protein